MVEALRFGDGNPSPIVGSAIGLLPPLPSIDS